MRKIIFIIGISLVVACSKDKDSTPNNLHTYQAAVKENFTDPFKRIDNIQVEDFIPYTLAIEDSGDDENIEYRLTSVRESQDYHQTIGKDFGLYLKKDDNTPYNIEKKYISFYNKGVHNFYIRPFVAGNFKLTFELQKFVNGETVGEAVKLNISFNALRFFLHKDSGGGSLAFPFIFLGVENSKKSYYYYIDIDAGSEKNDKYIEGADKFIIINGKYKVTYLVNDKEKTREAHFGIFPYIFIEHFDKEDPPKIRVTNIRIIQSIGEEDAYTMEYHNLNISNY